MRDFWTYVSIPHNQRSSIGTEDCPPIGSDVVKGGFSVGSEDCCPGWVLAATFPATVALSARVPATILIIPALILPAMSVKLFGYRGAAKDGGTLEYVFEQNSP